MMKTFTWPVLLGISLLARGEQALPADRLSLLQLTAAPQNISAVQLQSLRNLQPDLIVVGEVNRRAEQPDILRALADALDYHYRFVSAEPSGLADRQGMVVLSRLPLLAESAPQGEGQRYLRLLDGDHVLALYLQAGATDEVLSMLQARTALGSPSLTIGALTTSQDGGGAPGGGALSLHYEAVRLQPSTDAASTQPWREGDWQGQLRQWRFVDAPAGPRPWMDPTLSPDRRAALLLAQLRSEEKFQLLHSYFGLGKDGGPRPAGALGSAGYVPAIERLGVPAQQIVDAGLGVTNPGGIRPGDYATAMPSGTLLAATWSAQLAYQAGEVMGREAWRQGMNVLLAGGVNLQRDPRNGRNFEYAGEDPLLAGRIVAAVVRGVQNQQVLSTVKHFAMNDLETARNSHSALLGSEAMHESDLLAFQLAIEQGHPGAVMCSYNRINGEFGCENRFLLDDVLRQEWGYRGYVMSDWGGVHSAAKAALAGLDQESAGEVFDPQVFFDAPLRQALAEGTVGQVQIDSMVGRILRSLFAVGLFDRPPQRGPIDGAGGKAAAQQVAEQGIVLLRNNAGVLPFDPKVRRILVVGGHADKGVIGGGGSSMVGLTVDGGNAVPGLAPTSWPGPVMFHPSSPLAALRRALPHARIDYLDGNDPVRLAKMAARADRVVVFATQWSAESVDLPDMRLPQDQDQLISTVAQANPHTVVVLESNGPVRLPWLDKVAGLLEAWYPGIGGGEAIARVIAGQVNPSGRLPVSWPRDESQLPRPSIPGLGFKPARPAADSVDYTVEGANVGYKWFAAKELVPRFPFGYGLGYSRFSYGGMKLVVQGHRLIASFEVRNEGTRAGTDVPQLYVRLPAGRQTPIRLGGWTRISLAPGEVRRVRIDVEPRMLADFDAQRRQWQIPAGRYELQLSHAAGEVSSAAYVALEAQTLDGTVD